MKVARPEGAVEVLRCRPPPQLVAEYARPQYCSMLMMFARAFGLTGLALATGCAAHESPRALTPRELANVTAFANALGFVRFFHPTDAAEEVNWDAFAVRGIRAVQGAASPDSLASTLTRVFAPITSDVRFARTGLALPTTIKRPADATHALFWRHFSVGSPSGGDGIAAAVGAYHSERVVAPLSDVGHPITLDSTQGTVVSLPPVPDR